ncbi:UFD1-domain-containing protein [Thelephora ganbajun]|uniref:UFD1-domain-containing protein n=1 Tax=Thelephora ganbajun TaxID=370292 RepID=A0ACB6ZCX4_THEGA|nr:UFD1-domain-containing protein [Thelephora ganbajun]
MDFFGPNVGPNLFAQLVNGIGGHLANPRQFDQHLKAYSVAMLPGKERENLSYGGKIIMPPSALAHLTSLDLQSPWKFKLHNPANSAASTHAGVLEFIAQEGVVHLPYWMMKTLRLNEGDPVRITGAELPKGKMVKLQAQSVHFLEVSDPKAVLEQALRHFSCLTQGDIIEIIYNSIVFGFLIMETNPGGEGIDVLDTDLEVDFATPKGYVEPERPKVAPPATMASKLKIDLNQQTPGSSRPSSSQSGVFVGPSRVGGTTLSKDGDTWESFKGKGQTLEGRKTKGRGISHRKVEEVTTDSRIIRTDKHRIVTNSSLENDSQAPAPLNLPFGKLFFGYRYVEYVPPDSDKKGKSKAKSAQGGGNSEHWGEGQKLGKGAWKPSGVTGAGGASIPVLPSRIGKSTANQVEEREKTRSPSPDWGVDDDDMIDYDSD